MKLYVFFTYGVSLKTWHDAGILTREIALYNKLHSLGVDTTFVTYGNNTDVKYIENMPGISAIPIYGIVKRPRNRVLRFLQSFLLPFYLLQWVREADVLKSKQMLGSWVPSIISILQKKPYLLRTGYDYLDFIKRQKYSYIFQMIISVIFRFAVKTSRYVIVATLEDKQRLLTYGGNCQSKVVIAPNWVDIDKFRNIREVEKHKNRILFVGRIAEQKNLPMLIDAVVELNIGLDIVGSGELCADLKNYVNKTGGDVQFLGVFDNNELPIIYNRYYLYVLTSKYEGNPKTLLEAMSCELAVIGTNVAGIREVIKSGSNGLLAAESSDSVRDMINAIFEDSTMRQRISKRAREFIVLNHSLSSYANYEFKLLQSMMKKTKRG